MHPWLSVGTLAACASAAHAFAGTYPVVAYADTRLPLTSLLNPAPSVRTATTAPGQQAFSATTEGADVEQADLCSLSSLLVIAAPGLAYSDLALLPSSADSVVRAALSASNSDDQHSAVTLPYVSDRLAGAHAPVSRLARRLALCDQGAAQQRPIVIEVVHGLEETEAGIAKDRAARREVMRHLDDVVQTLLASAPTPHAVVISAVSPSLGKSRPDQDKKKKGCAHTRASLVKRQADLADEYDDAPTSDEAYVEELLEEIVAESKADEAAFSEMLSRPTVEDDSTSASGVDADAEDLTQEEYAATVDPYLSEEEGSSPDDISSSLAQLLDSDPYDDEDDNDGDDDDEGSGNGTSIFQPKPNSGLFHRYVFFTPALILSILVTVVLLIPTVIVGASALLAIETPQGLETKMTGSVGIDPNKAQ